jgi:hypothetical protein
VSRASSEQKRGALFLNVQFMRAIHEGMVAILKEDLKTAILQAYTAMSRANQHILAEVNQDVNMTFKGTAAIKAREAIADAGPAIEAASRELARFLAREDAG